jgi:hypothetical protein
LGWRHVVNVRISAPSRGCRQVKFRRGPWDDQIICNKFIYRWMESE